MRCALRRLALGFLLCSANFCDSPRSPTVPPSGIPPVATPPATQPSRLPPKLKLSSIRKSDDVLPPLQRAAEGTLLVEAPPLAALSKNDEGAPISLTASDGTGLRLVSMKASAVVQGPLAFTELHLVFENPEPRRLEGRFSIVLPTGAAISRFAMQLATGWQEAEVVERQAARRAYEDFLHRRQDPALLEHEAGNQFSARVFPIEANAKKEIKLSYSQELSSAEEPYRLPLVGLPQMSDFGVTAIAGDQVTEVMKRDFRPASDLIIRAPNNVAGRAAGLRSDDIMVARVRIGEGETIAAARVPSLLVLFDTSASRAPGFAARVRELGELFAALAKSSDAGAFVPLTVACFDQSIETIYQGPLGQFGEAQLGRITQRGALGASNLQAALHFAATQKNIERVLLLSDGVVTAGAADKALGTTVDELKAAGVKRLDAALYGGIRDESAMTRLLSGHLAQDGALIDGNKGTTELVRRFTRATLSDVKVQVAGAAWVYPQKLDGVQPGDDVLVYAEFPEQVKAPAQAATVSLSGPLRAEKQVPLFSVNRPLLERSLVRAYIKSLDSALANLDPKQAKAEVNELRHDIVSLSTQFRVLSDETALLVLETEADYARFSIDRKALADIMTVGNRGIELYHRNQAIFAVEKSNNDTPPLARNKLRENEGRMDKATAASDEEPAKMQGAPADPASNGVLGALAGAKAGSVASIFGRDSALGRDADDAMGGLVGTEVGEAYGAAAFGLVGSGQGGGGTGEGTVGLGNLGTIGRGSGSPGGTYGARGPLRSRRSVAPQVAAGVAEVRGSLDKELIRRIIRRHINEVRFCYESGLTRNPALAGRIMVQFVITATGQVGTAYVQSSTMGNPAVEQCVAGAVRRWEFPHPVGGIVVVTYPFVFVPDGDVGVTPQSWRESPGPRSPSSVAVAGPGANENSTPAYTGKMAEVMGLLKQGQLAQALPLVEKWRGEDAGDILALVALGEVMEARGDKDRASRAYGSIIDLFPSRADLRRFAGERLERLGSESLDLAVDTYEKAVAQRPDHPASHRLLAYALYRKGDLEAAFAAVENGASRQYPDGRFRGVDRILREDLGLLGAAWGSTHPEKVKDIATRLQKFGVPLAVRPSLRFVLNWETDANDVDFHIHDGKGGHAFFSDPKLASGGELYADVTTGYGPECFTIEGKPAAFPYRLEAHYYSRGPMGYGMGKLQIIQHDGKGNLKLVERPFVVMNDHAYVDLGTLKAPL